MQMGAFGRRLRPPLSFMDAQVDPEAAPVPNASFATSQVAPSGQPPVKPMGAFGRIRHWATPEHLQALGATFRQLGGVDGALAEEMQRQQQGLANEAARVRQATEDKYRRRLQEQTDADRQADNDRQDARDAETARHNRVSEGIDYTRATRESGTGMPTLAEARQWTNSYNDDVRSANNDLGNMRAALPYAHQVVQARGQPSGNFRMNDVALLRAAARAQTGPGVLTESEVFGTLSPSLQQSLTRNLAYADISRAGISPQDRLALAQYVQTAQRNAAGDLWRRYNDAENVLSARGVEPSNVGISAPEYLHPEDMDSFGSVPDSTYRQGRQYVAPSGRRYIYLGEGRWRYTGREEYNRERVVNRNQPPPPRPPNIPADARWDAATRRWERGS